MHATAACCVGTLWLGRLGWSGRLTRLQVEHHKLARVPVARQSHRGLAITWFGRHYMIGNRLPWAADATAQPVGAVGRRGADHQAVQGEHVSSKAPHVARPGCPGVAVQPSRSCRLQPSSSSRLQTLPCARRGSARAAGGAVRAASLDLRDSVQAVRGQHCQHSNCAPVLLH